MLTQFRFATLAIAAGGLTLATPAAAIPVAHYQNTTSVAAYGDMTASYDDDDDDRRWGRGDRYDRREARRYQRDQRRYARQQQTWRGDDGRQYCRKSDGTTGLIIGGAGGALLGREIAGRNGDRTLGAILGAAGGALLGKSIDSKVTCR